MARITEAQAAAKRHIAEIRSEFDIHDRPRIVAVVNNSLNTLAEELYDSSTHFLDELLQNADDLHYTSEQTIRFKYQPGYLTITTNETGFNHAHVEAICSIRKSTKSGKSSSEEFTGEKGIGFKSIFKVADEVSIVSGPYSFKFDKHQQFGMINPIWIDHEEVPIPNHTCITLKLSKEHDAQELVKELREFSLDRLLFLRKLERVDIEISSPPDTCWKTTLRRSDKSSSSGVETRTLSLDSMESSYIIRRHRVLGLPYELRRPDSKYSGLTLAFSLTGNDAVPPSHNVYAHLPISDYGLHFALDGDFLLTANRQLIDMSSKWNIHLRDALTDAFVDAVIYFNDISGPMMYSWLNYIPSAETRPFFQPARSAILEKLRNTEILRSDSQSSREVTFKPSSLVYVNLEKYADHERNALTLRGPDDCRYLSSRYPEHTIDILCALGVRRMDDQKFLTDMEWLIEHDRESFHARSDQWHSSLAKALLPLTEWPELRARIERLPIIPLMDDSWISANACLRQGVVEETGVQRYFRSLHERIFPTRRARSTELIDEKDDKPAVYFCSSDIMDEVSIHELPSDLLVVQQDATIDHSRKSLFERLGIRHLQAAQLCEHICDTHASKSFQPSKWSTDQLVSHAKFLHRAVWRPPTGGIDLWFATSNGTRSKGSDCYFPGSFIGSEDSAHKRVFDKLRSFRSVIDDAYLADTTVDWRTFLLTTLRLSTVPRLIERKPDAKEEDFVLSKDFQMLFRECAVTDVLEVLCDNWQDYSQYLESGSNQSSGVDATYSKFLLTETIKQQEVKTRDGYSKLSATVLPNLDAYLEQHSTILPVLDVSTPNDKAVCRKLGLFSISTETDLDYYLSCLRHLRARDNPNENVLSHIYAQLQARYDELGEAVDIVFVDEKLIYTKQVPSKSTLPIGWVTLNECMQRKIAIAEEYPQSKDFFRWLFAYSPVKLQAMIARATQIDGSLDLCDIVDILIDVSAMLADLSKAAKSKAVRPLLKEHIFPITRKESLLQYERLAAIDDKSWFIADMPIYRKSFQGKIAMLAASVSEINEMEDLIEALGMDGRTLSKAVHSRTSPKGPLRFNARKTRELHDRVAFIKLLIPGSTPDKHAITRALDLVHVTTAARIDRELELKINDSTCFGRPVRGDVHSTTTDGRLKLFVEDEGNLGRFSLDFADAIARFCKLEKNELHLRLLYVTLSDKPLFDIRSAFELAGFNVPVDTKKEKEPAKRQSSSYHVHSGSLLKIPDPWATSQSDYDSDASDDCSNVGFQSDRRANIENQRRKLHDRRIEMRPIELSELSPSVGIVSEHDLDPNNTLKFIGEYATSMFFAENLGGHYRAAQHWTSSARTQVGLKPFNTEIPTAAFTLGDAKASRAVTKFLREKGYTGADTWATCIPKYHFEIAPTAEDWRAPFAWDSAKFELMRNLQLSKETIRKPKDVLILLRISSIYTQPCFHLFVDPWNLVTAGHFTLPGDAIFQAVVDPLTLVLSDTFDIPETVYSRNIVKKHNTGLSKCVPTADATQEQLAFTHLKTTFVSSLGSEQSPNIEYAPESASVAEFVLPAPLGVYGTRTFPTPWRMPFQPAPHSSGIFAISRPQTDFLHATYNPNPTNTYVQPMADYNTASYDFGKSSSPAPTAAPLHSVDGKHSSQPNYQYSYSPYATPIQPHLGTIFYHQDAGYGHGYNVAQYPTYYKQPIPTSPAPSNIVLTRDAAHSLSKRTKHHDGQNHLKDLQNVSTLSLDYWSLRQWVPPDTQAYVYRALEAQRFRLFILFPGEKDEKISGAIYEHDVNDAPPYQTLSYTWGKPDQEMHKMWTPEGCLCIHDSLHATLQRLRFQTGAVILWIDAVCIDQRNELEKRDQIRLLPKIFQGAACTLAFVGADGEADGAIELLMQIRAKQVHGQASDKWPKNISEVPASWAERAFPEPHDVIWRAVVAFFKRPWFRRAWIVQEIIAAPTVKVVCGKWRVDWSDLYFAMELVEKELEITQQIDRSAWKPFMTLAQHREWWARQKGWPLYLLLEAFRPVESTLVRDRFFSLLGLAEDGHLAEHDPDYNQSTPLEDIVCRFARSFVTLGYGMEILYRAGLSTQPDRFPSWTPDWTCRKPDSISLSQERGIFYAAAGSTKKDVRVLAGSNNTITVRSMVVDEITHVSRSFNRPKEPSRLAQYFKEIDTMIDTHLKDSHTKFQREAMKWRVPVGDAQHPKIAVTGDVDVQESYKALRSVLKKVTYRGAKEAQYLTQDPLEIRAEQPTTESEGAMLGMKEKSLNYHALVQDSIKGWAFVITKNKRCGIVPRKAAVGDLISIFSGGNVPFLIRKSNSAEPQRHRLIGECYIHEIMDGEAVEGKNGAWGVVELH